MPVQTSTVVPGISDTDSSDPRPEAPQRRSGMHPWVALLIVHTAVTIGQILIWIGCLLTFRGALAIARWVTFRLEPLTRRSRHANQKLFFEPNRGADLEAI